MLRKTEKHQYFFEAGIKRLQGNEGVLSAHEVSDIISVATPEAFAGGIPGKWSPEQLFLGALSSCTMTTYLAIAAKKHLRIVDFQCSAIGLVQLVEGHLEFTSIELFPKIFVLNAEDMPAANEVLLKAYKHCIIGNSVKTPIVHHGEVAVLVPALEI